MIIVEAMADDERRSSFQSSPPTAWGEGPHIYPHSHHGTPAQEYTGFNFNTPQMPMEPSAFRSIQQRPLHPQLQPLIMPQMPQWPSMLSSQSHTTFHAQFPQPLQPIQPLNIGPLQTPTPISATSARPATTPRKTLTDSDRKRMCLYAEEHPGSKQTEIGAIFGVERSTVSKVLRQKEKYLLQDDGSRSPVKRAKGRSPDIERALAVWAKNQEKKGFPLNDEIIRDKARAFSATSASPENIYTQSSSWIEKFKLNNNLMGARSRKGSLAPDDAEAISTGASSSHTPGGTSPMSPKGIGSSSPQELHSAPSQESLKHESPDSYIDFGRHVPFHSQSTNSLHSAFTETTTSAFSPGPLSPTSPFFTPESGTAPGPFVPLAGSLHHRLGPSTVPNAQRPRSQTFPLLDPYSNVAGPADEATPKYDLSTPILDSPMEEVPEPLVSIDQVVRVSDSEDRPHTVAPAETMRPPPLPAHILAGEVKREITPATSMSSLQSATTADEARQALEVVLSFIHQQPTGYLDNQQHFHVGALMEKLKLHSRAGS